MSKTKDFKEEKANENLAHLSFSDEQKKYLIKKLQEHWNIEGDSTHWLGIKMAKKVISKL